jgi:hypothetical protein
LEETEDKLGAEIEDEQRMAAKRHQTGFGRQRRGAIAGLEMAIAGAAPKDDDFEESYSASFGDAMKPNSDWMLTAGNAGIDMHQFNGNASMSAKQFTTPGIAPMATGPLPNVNNQQRSTVGPVIGPLSEVRGLWDFVMKSDAMTTHTLAWQLIGEPDQFLTHNLVQSLSDVANNRPVDSWQPHPAQGIYETGGPSQSYLSGQTSQDI